MQTHNKLSTTLVSNPMQSLGHQRRIQRVRRWEEVLKFSTPCKHSELELDAIETSQFDSMNEKPEAGPIYLEKVVRSKVIAFVHKNLPNFNVVGSNPYHIQIPPVCLTNKSFRERNFDWVELKQYANSRAKQLTKLCANRTFQSRTQLKKHLQEPQHSTQDCHCGQHHQSGCPDERNHFNKYAPAKFQYTPYHCKICNKRFTSRKEGKSHVFKVHNIQISKLKSNSIGSTGSALQNTQHNNKQVQKHDHRNVSNLNFTRKTYGSHGSSAMISNSNAITNKCVDANISSSSNSASNSTSSPNMASSSSYINNIASRCQPFSSAILTRPKSPEQRTRNNNCSRPNRANSSNTSNSRGQQGKQVPKHKPRTRTFSESSDEQTDFFPATKGSTHPHSLSTTHSSQSSKNSKHCKKVSANVTGQVSGHKATRTTKNGAQNRTRQQKKRKYQAKSNADSDSDQFSEIIESSESDSLDKSDKSDKSNESDEMQEPKRKKQRRTIYENRTETHKQMFESNTSTVAFVMEISDDDMDEMPSSTSSTKQSESNFKMKGFATDNNSVKSDAQARQKMVHLISAMTDKMIEASVVKAKILSEMDERVNKQIQENIDKMIEISDFITKKIN